LSVPSSLFFFFFFSEEEEKKRITVREGDTRITITQQTNREWTAPDNPKHR